MVKFCLILIAGGIISVGLTIWATQGTLTSTFDGSRLAIEKTSFAIMPSVIITTIVTTVIVGILALVVTLFVSHKIAGPMFRFEKDLQDISDGNLQKMIHIRQGDQFGSVAKNLNEMVQNVKGMLGDIQDDLEKLQQNAKDQGLPESFVQEIEACRLKIDQKFKL